MYLPFRSSCRHLINGRAGISTYLVGSLYEVRDHPRAGYADHNALEGGGLGDAIVYCDLESGRVHFGPGTLHALAVHILREIGHGRLHDEHPLGAQVPRGVLEATHVSFLGRQVEDSVEHQVDQIDESLDLFTFIILISFLRICKRMG